MTKQQVISYITGLTPGTAFDTVTYAVTTNITYNSLLPNKVITLAGNITVNMNGTANGNSGLVAIIRAAGGGSETLAFNGTIYGTNTYPTGASALVLMSYININGTLYWNLIK